MIERAEFGRTGHQSTRVIFGAAGLGQMGQERADEVLEIVLEFGVNHIDTAASYGDSELRLAPWLAIHRDDVFLATKTGDRTAGEARASVERSLQRLGVEQIDLIQLHNLVEDDEWETAHGPGGALEALVQARDEGLVRFIGVTGHGIRIPSMHSRSLARFDYDSVLLPYSFVQMQDPAYRADVEALLATCAERRVAAQTIKSVARRRWQDDSEPHHAWYEPLRDDEAIGRAVRYVLGNEQVFVISSSDAGVLRPILQAASTSGDVPSSDELQADVERNAMTPLFDGGELERI